MVTPVAFSVAAAVTVSAMVVTRFSATLVIVTCNISVFCTGETVSPPTVKAGMFAGMDVSLDAFVDNMNEVIPRLSAIWRFDVDAMSCRVVVTCKIFGNCSSTHIIIRA